ncbi:uncharacterized protein LOC111061711, partial [Nilaparvata lugens]|uniref:uncharacterized protein LOC111061711 n=1 Tax=Nilaparvata lugens TaxID=108931 RepID=UPI00193C8C38
VVNVDEEGQKLHDGQLEVTDTDLIVYQRQRSPVRWPLRSLRRYGFDADIFSFESGRRCRTGPGVYAFRCRRAEELFNLLQSHIQMRNSTTEDAISRELSGTQLSHQHQRPVSCGSGSEYMEPTPLRPETTPLRQETTQLRHNSVASNGPLSPASAVLPSSPPYVNGDLPAAAATTRQHCRQLSRSFSSNSASLALAVPSEAAPTLRRDNQPAPLMFTQSHTSYERTTVVQVSPTYSISSETNLMARMEECRVIAADGGSEDGAANGGTPFYINIKPGMHNLQSPPPVACAGDRCPGSDRLQACAGDSDRLVRPRLVRICTSMPTWSWVPTWRWSAPESENGEISDATVVRVAGQPSQQVSGVRGGPTGELRGAGLGTGSARASVARVASCADGRRATRAALRDNRL